MSQSNCTNYPQDGKPPLPDNFQLWLERRSQAGNWFFCFDDYLEVMSIVEAWVLQRIVNLGKLVPKSKKRLELRKQGWILVTVGYLQKKTKLGPNSQVRVLSNLQGKYKDKPKNDWKIDPKRAFIEVQCFGVPRKRYVRVNLIKIEQAIDAATSSDNGFPVIADPVSLVVPELGDKKYNPTPNGVEEVKKRRPPSGGSDDAPTNGFLPAKHECSPAAHKDARRLYEKVSKAGLLGSNRSSVKEWGCWLDKTKAALEAEERPVQYDELFKFHLAQLGKVGQPEAFCGRSFYEKRVALVRAWSRFKAKKEEQAQWQAKKEGVVKDQLGSDRRWDTEEDDYI